jgi:hypothetical protein
MMPEMPCFGDGESIEFPLLCGSRQSYACAGVRQLQTNHLIISELRENDGSRDGEDYDVRGFSQRR